MLPGASGPRGCKSLSLCQAWRVDCKHGCAFERCALNSLPWTLSELNVFFIMRRAIYPGSFDPVTNGHLDVIERARKLFDEVIVAVAHNDEKQALFSLQERLDLLKETAAKIDNVRTTQFDGLLVEFEFQMALMNRKLEASVETIFLMPKEEFTYLSSRLVKEIARLGGDVSSFVPPAVAKALGKKFAASKKK